MVPRSPERENLAGEGVSGSPMRYDRGDPSSQSTQRPPALHRSDAHRKLDTMYSIVYIWVMSPRHAVRNHVRRHRRQLHDITQQELADRVGVTRQTILSIEKGRYNPSVGLAMRIAGTFGVPVEALFEIDREDDHG